MGTMIKESAVILGNGEDDSSIDICARAAREVIEKSGLERKDVDLLINIGINRDKNIVEPAVASLIQKKARININPTRKHLARQVGTLSFDILHGSCGFIQAVQVATAFLQVGRYKYAIIVSSEVHPSGKKPLDFPFTHSGAAILLEYANDEKGFKNFIFETSKEGSTGLEIAINIPDNGANCRNLIAVEIEEDYPDRLQKFVFKTINDYVEKGVFNLKEIDHIITTTHSESFGRNIADTLGFQKNTLIEIYDKYGNTYSSSSLIGYHTAKESGALKDGDKVFFVSGGSGLSCALSMYVV